MEYAIWIILIVAMLVIEASTTNLVSIWFAVGCLGAIVAKILGTDIYIQILVFFVISGLSLALAWPFIKKHRQQKSVATNYDMIIGKTAIVTDDISGDKFAGSVKVGGKEWSAVSETGDDIYAGEKVVVKSISGVKLVVDKIKTENKIKEC
ncbi:MAG: NfeD family protein [Clostridia bacterium]|nr:NfeD family protein [Clostridia bacterium]